MLHLDVEPHRFQLLVAGLTGLVQPAIWADIDLRGREGLVFFRAMRLAILQVAQKRTPHHSNTQERTTRQDTLADTRAHHETGHTHRQARRRASSQKPTWFDKHSANGCGQKSQPALAAVLRVLFGTKFCNRHCLSESRFRTV